MDYKKHATLALGLLIGAIIATPAQSAEALYFFHTDHLGTPQAMTDENQTVVWQAHYEPFGTTNIVTNQIENNLRFPGQYFDNESGLHYNYFRDYDPSIGRYTESDPIGLDGGINTYAYVGGNPLTRIDPLGLHHGSPCANGDFRCAAGLPPDTESESRCIFECNLVVGSICGPIAKAATSAGGLAAGAAAFVVCRTAVYIPCAAACDDEDCE